MNLKGKHIIFFSQFRFDAMESGNYTIAKHLAKDNYVYYIDRPYTWRDYFQFKNTPGFKTRKSRFFSADNCIIDTDIPNLKNVIMPPVPSINILPEGWIYRMALKINEKIVAARLKKVIKKMGITDYIYFNSYNFLYPTLQNLLKPVLNVYQCIDPLIEPYQRRHGVVSETILLKEADLVFCTSKALRDLHKPLNENTFFVPNAANINHSQKALDPNLSEASILAGIKKPIIGFFGNIERRIDYDLVTELLATNRDKSFVFVGPVDRYYVKEDYKAENLYLTGEVPYDQMPAVLKGFDVAIIPFKKDGVSSTIFPLKLFEYLGSGRPVVSTDFNPDLKDYTFDTVTYCKNAAEFSKAIEESLHDDAKLLEKRLKIAADNTWEHRIAEIKVLLQLNYDKKRAFRQPESK